MNGTKKRRGRPRKRPARLPPGSATVAPDGFEALPPGPLKSGDLQAVLEMIHGRMKAAPAVAVPFTQGPEDFLDRVALDQVAHFAPVPPSSTLTAWLEAAAAALKANDAGRVAYYLLRALKCREVELAARFAELATIGQEKLVADRRRGRRT
jgi:hypothetical protein